MWSKSQFGSRGGLCGSKISDYSQYGSRMVGVGSSQYEFRIVWLCLAVSVPS